MRCDDLRKLISEYIDGELERELRVEFEEHLSHCERCQIVITTTRRTISIYQRTSRRRVPDETTRRLRETLRALREKSLDL
jgi:anti-sigma factor RsiW